MRARTGLRAEDLASFVRQALARVGYEFLTNTATRVTEFEVTSPSHFRVVLTDLSGPQVGFPFRKPNRIESSIEILPTLGFGSSETIRSSVKTFVDELGRQFPRPPWSGLGPFASRSEKGKWGRLIEI